MAREVDSATLKSENIVQQMARETLALVNVLIGDARKYCIFPNYEPNRSCMALLAASMQHANTINSLLQTDPVTYGASAFALLRPQIETLMRAQFLCRVATLDEFREFVLRDKGIYIRNEKKPNEYVPIRHKEMMIRILQAIAKNTSAEDALVDTPDNMAAIFYEDYERLSSLVHGGPRLIGHFRDDGELTHFDMTLAECSRVFVTSANMCALALSEICMTSLMDNSHRMSLARSGQNNFNIYRARLDAIVERWLQAQGGKIDTSTNISKLINGTVR